ncbi:protein SAR DEFICIENT 1-like [Impatiens glandulifera]|uniref:protein SAR DEFICIENT 1-like n=1 Tax=Impatiens glandulifera TaxID=253017 RepID=UPI001FB0CB64|nr:protein SAR DEFICIENT 1-like [Impatiens glandulifera]
MAAKRYFPESGIDMDHQTAKRTKSKPSFASVISEVLMVNFMQNFCSTMEPMIRKVVKEEVERGLKIGGKSLIRSSSIRVQALEQSNFRLVFRSKLSLPIFTGTKISDMESNPLQIYLVDSNNDHMMYTNPLKVEIVVLDGDFPKDGSDTWTSDEFNRNIVKERAGRRPLLTGDLSLTMRDGYAVVGQIEFTDNSSWIRSRKFRLGARVVQGSEKGTRVCEAITESFVVRDHRGELYKKHHPPMLEDEVWRLEKIGKDGAFHKKLNTSGINTVQDFLQLSVVDPTKLRKILGVGMSDRMWEVTLRHAKTCEMGSKLYIFKGPNYSLLLDPVCHLVKAMVNGQSYPCTKDLVNMNRGFAENLVKEAYQNWKLLEEIDGHLNTTPLLTQGEQMEEYPNQSMERSNYQSQPAEVNDSMSAGNTNFVSSEWLVSSQYYQNNTPENAIGYQFLESSSDEDPTPARCFFYEGQPMERA